MIKQLLLVIMLSSGMFISNPHIPVRSSPNENDNLILESKENGHYKVVGVTDSDVSDIRIYYNEEYYVDEIALGAFDAAFNLESLMISYTVTSIPSPLFTIPGNHPNFNTINYTGSETEWNDLNYLTSYTVFTDACDEGFIRLWNRDVRPQENSSVCDISPALYERVIELYETLSDNDRQTVDEYVDLAGSNISDSISTLRNFFEQPDTSYSEDREVSSSTMISFVIIIAVVGMTFIMVFYYLKDKHIIQ